MYSGLEQDSVWETRFVDLIVIIYSFFNDALSNSDSTAPKAWVTVNSTMQGYGRKQLRTVIRLLEVP